MDKLSQELVDRIISHFDPWWDRDHLRQFLTVSRPFHSSVERVVFAQYQLGEDNAERFLRQYTPGRTRHLRYVQCVPTFPRAHGDRRNWDEGCREKSHEFLEKDRMFTRQIMSLFRTLKRLEDRVGMENIRGKLHLTIFTPRRPVVDNPCRHLVCVCHRVHLLDPETLPRISSIHTLKFQDNTSFGAASRMYRWDSSVFHHAPSKLDLRVIMEIASKIMTLVQLEGRFLTYFHGMHATDETARHFMQDWAGPHRDTRHDFARLLDSIKLPSLKRIDLNFHAEREQFGDQWEVLPNLILPRQYDPFSTSLRILSYQLETMILRVTVDQTIFWPVDGTTPHWPNLKYLDVFFRAHSPSGEWYFQGPRGEGSDTSPGYKVTQAHYEPMESNATDRFYDKRWSSFDNDIVETVPQFRIVPIERTLRPLLVAFAKAASNMPSLRIGLLRTGLEFYPGDVFDDYEEFSNEIVDAGVSVEDLSWGIAYASPGERLQNDALNFRPCKCKRKHPLSRRKQILSDHHEALRQIWNYGTTCASRQFWWWTQDWRPDGTLYSLFDEIGQSEHGNTAIHHWPSDQGTRWYGQSMFNDLIKCPTGVPEKLVDVLWRLNDS